MLKSAQECSRASGQLDHEFSECWRVSGQFDKSSMNDGE